MGIVQKQRKKIENLEAKNRMLKRMYESQKTATAKAALAQHGAETVVKCVIAKTGGGILITKDELEQAKKYEMVGRVLPDQSFEYLIPELVELEPEEEKTE